MTKETRKNAWFDLKTFIPFITTTIIGIGSWFGGQYYNTSRDIENKRREILTEYLIDAYRNIAAFSGWSPQESQLRDISKITEEEIKMIKNIEQAIADIQLFGSIYQIREIREICKKAGNPEFVRDKDGNILAAYKWSADNLLMDLRRDLRDYLKLEKIDDEEDKKEGIQWLRWSRFINDIKTSKKQ